jgi:hypothetical protein
VLTANFFKKSLIKNANLLKKGLTENGGINFKSLIPNPYRRVINRRNGWWSTGATVAVQRLCLIQKPLI